MEQTKINDQDQKVICISHIKDVDGCVSAAIVKNVTKSRILLANYGNMNTCLRRIYDTYVRVYVCDLGINEATIDEFERIRQFAEITYIDHHDLNRDVLQAIENLGVQIIHNKLDCAGVLTYNHFKEDLPNEAKLLASYAAVSDRLENGPLAKKLLRRYSRDFVLFEAMLLSYAIENADSDFKKKLVPKLSKFMYPHQIPGISSLALEQINEEASLRRILPFRIQKMGNVCYVNAKEYSLGMIANLILELSDAKIGLAYDTNENVQITDISIRSSHNSKVNLGRKTTKLAKMLGGTGGGHPKASGARIPASKLMDFIRGLG